MNQIYQRNKYDCGVACLAMLLDTHYDKAQDLLRRRVGDLVDPSPDHDGSPVIGVTAYEVASVLADHGWATVSMTIPNTTSPSHWYDRVADQMPVLRPRERLLHHAEEGGVALLGVSSLHHEGGMHWIVMEGFSLYDPNQVEPRYHQLGDGPNGDGTPISDYILILGRIAKGERR